jgi:hypothetical protein
MKPKSTIRFSAILSQTNITLPKSANAKLPKQGSTMIEGVIDSSPFRTALISRGHGNHRIGITKAMRDAFGVNVGDTVKVEITRVGKEPETRVPMDLRKALAASPKAKISWADITPMARRDWIFSISGSKQPETRIRRIEKACDMLASGKRRLCCFPGIKWLMKKNARSCGMWLSLVK